MTAAAGWAPVTEPRLIPDVDEDVYHAGGIHTPGAAQLSQSLLKLLLPPSTPAHFKWRLTHPEPNKREFDIGRAAHSRVLGRGQEMAACPEKYLAKNGAMTTTLARAWCDEQRALGIVPLNPRDYDMVCAMADALVHHDRVAEILTEPSKLPEVSAFAPHPDAPDLWFRGRFDLLGGQLWDYKTTKSAEPSAFRKSAWSYGYHIQDVLYRTLLEQITGEVSPPMVFIAQEKTPPYLTTVVTLDVEFERLAREQIAAALDLYRACAAADVWPGYPDAVAVLSPPPYADRAQAGVEYEPEF